MKPSARAQHTPTEAFLAHAAPLFGGDAPGYAWLAVQQYRQHKAPVILVVQDHTTLQQTLDGLNFLAPELTALPLPAWDVQPYDRQPPDPLIQAQRMAALSALHAGSGQIIVTTVNAVSTRVLPATALPKPLVLTTKTRIQPGALARQLVALGYQRTETVMERGEFAVRGGIVDVFPILDDQPVRLDFFDDALESLKPFDPTTQRSEGSIPEVTCGAAQELILDEERIRAFRHGYRVQLNGSPQDTLYATLSEGTAHDMMLHFLPLFFEDTPLATLWNYLPEKACVLWHPAAQAAIEARMAAVEEAHRSRHELLNDTSWGAQETYRPIPAKLLYFTATDWQSPHRHFLLHRFADDSASAAQANIHPLQFTTENTTQALDDAVAQAKAVLAKKGRVVFSSFMPSGSVKLEKMLAHHGLEHLVPVTTLAAAQPGKISLVTSSLPYGFYDTQQNLLMITEQDLYGSKQHRRVRPKRNPEEMITHFSELSPGDYVVHADHGIGRFVGLEHLHIDGAVQDFVKLYYEGDDKLYVPVVNLDVLSRYASPESGSVILDKLGGAGWQARKAKAKKDLLAIAGDLMKTAAARELQQGHRYSPPDGLYDEFCAKFGHVPTEEQQFAFGQVEADLTSSKPMDRLIVGDVGFGKTEVALRAAYIAAADGKQVAVVVPTTLLARQHYANFSKRFNGFPFRVAQLSRLVPAAQAKKNKAELAAGKVDIIIGTHALLAKSIAFKDLGLLIIDEEQHFGVKHKERLKELRSTVDVLTLTATPIPRTLNMSLTGLKELSLITTPPVDRLAVRTYVMGFDPKTLREAISREIYRRGQVYVVTSRIEGLQELADKLQELVPEAKIRVAHGQMPAAALERTMEDFYDGTFNVLVSTNIVESGLDVTRANTLIVHRADRFGLSQLHQLRGRVGRGTVRAYAYFLLPEHGLTEEAERRLRILQRLQELGSGFQLAQFDMDMRGTGNVLGEQQSGHIRAIGFALYHQMLQEAIAEIQNKRNEKNAVSPAATPATSFTPTLNLGVSFLLPESYISNDTTRMRVYRELAAAHTAAQVDEVLGSIHDRFGPPPREVEALAEVIRLRNRCTALNIERLEAGNKGVVLGFYQNTFANPEGLIALMQQQSGIFALRPDHKLAIRKAIPSGYARLSSLSNLLSTLEEIADV